MQKLMPYIISASLSLMSGLSGVGVKILWGLATNVSELNSKMAVIVSELAAQGKRSDQVDAELRDHDGRIRHLERFIGP